MENAFLPYLEKLNINVNDLTRNYLITGCYWTEKGILHTKLGFKTLISIYSDCRSNFLRPYMEVFVCGFQQK